MGRLLPTPFFFAELYLQSSVPISIHLIQRGVPGKYFSERPRGNCSRVRSIRWIFQRKMRYTYLSLSSVKASMLRADLPNKQHGQWKVEEECVHTHASQAT